MRVRVIEGEGERHRETRNCKQYDTVDLKANSSHINITINININIIVNIGINFYLKQSPSFMGKGSPVLFLSPSITHVPARTVPYSIEGNGQIHEMKQTNSGRKR